eukprot:3186166-Prymnesium_polylepis.2
MYPCVHSHRTSNTSSRPIALANTCALRFYAVSNRTTTRPPELNSSKPSPVPPGRVISSRGRALGSEGCLGVSGGPDPPPQ